jgi:hypothetical protein
MIERHYSALVTGACYAIAARLNRLGSVWAQDEQDRDGDSGL